MRRSMGVTAIFPVDLFFVSLLFVRQARINFSVFRALWLGSDRRLYRRPAFFISFIFYHEVSN